MIGIEDGAAHADAHTRPHELDPFAYARDELATLVFMSSSSPQRRRVIGNGRSALDLVSERMSCFRQGRRCKSRSRPLSPLPFQG
jgi:hypothetical protein